jgi:hypothetical protein
MLPFGALALLMACAAPAPRATSSDFAIEMGNVRHEHLLHTRDVFDRQTTFYSFRRGGVVFELSAADLAQALEKNRLAAGAKNEGSGLAVKLRSMIAASVRVLREDEVASDLAREAESAFGQVFAEGGFRVTEGAERGSSLVMGDFSYAITDNGTTSAGNGVIFFWSVGRKPIFLVYDFVI